MYLFKTVGVAKSVLLVALLLGTRILYADTYDLEGFQLAGVSVGDSESEVVENIANYFSVAADQIQLRREKERPSKENAIGSSFSKFYQYEENRVTVRLYPDYLNGDGNERVVGSVTFRVRKEEGPEAQQVIEEMKNKIVAKKGEADGVCFSVDVLGSFREGGEARFKRCAFSRFVFKEFLRFDRRFKSWKNLDGKKVN